MRVDRFFEARFPGLSFRHIQRIVRKGEVRVNGRRTEPKARLEAGTLRPPRARGADGEGLPPTLTLPLKGGGDSLLQQHEHNPLPP